MPDGRLFAGWLPEAIVAAMTFLGLLLGVSILDDASVFHGVSVGDDAIVNMPDVPR